MAADDAGKIRIDKWLWYARFFKSRGLAAEVVSNGKVRMNGDRVSKTAQSVRAGDVLTFPQAKQVRVVRIEACGTRRGPAAEAQALYTDLTPAAPAEPTPESAPRQPGAGRPTKRARREIDAWHRRET